MMKFADNLWVGNSRDEQTADVDAVLNVAKDLAPTRGWPKVDYMHVGLVDGPGNPLSAYCAAVLALATLMRTGKRVLVNCHEGRSRSVSVAIMYLALVANCRSWDDQVAVLRERIDSELPVPHPAHREAFDSIDWTSILDACEE